MPGRQDMSGRQDMPGRQDMLAISPSSYLRLTAGTAQLRRGWNTHKLSASLTQKILKVS
jgi:hypothetical protein